MKNEREFKRIMGDGMIWHSIKLGLLAIIVFTALGRLAVWWFNI